MGNKKESNAFYIVLSILIAVVLWLYVVGEVNPDVTVTFRNVPITVTGEDVLANRGLMVSDLDKETVDLLMEGTRLSLTNLDSEDFVVTLDLSSINASGEWEILCKVNMPTTVGASGVSMDSRTNLNVKISVANEASKTINIKGKLLGTVAPNYQVDTFQFSPSTIVIKGQEDHVNLIDHAVVYVEEEELSTTYTGNLNFSLVDEDGNELENLNVTTSVDDVYVTLPVSQVKDIPLVVEFIPGGGATLDDITYTIVPSSISVSGDESALLPLEQLNLGTIDLSQVTESGVFSFDILLTPDLTNESGTQVATVMVEIEGLESKTFEASNIQIINEPSNYDVQLVTQSLPIVVRGKAHALAQVTTSQLRVVLDLDDEELATGQFKLPATIYLDSVSGVGVVGEYTVSVSVTK